MLTCLFYAEGKLYFDQYVDIKYQAYTNQSFQNFLDSDQFKKIREIAQNEHTEKPMFDLYCKKALKRILHVII